MAKTARQKIIKKLDDVVSEIVIIIDGKCVVCGRPPSSSPGKGRGLGAGHIFSRGAHSTRWDIHPEGNVHCQCWPCNFRHVRDQYPYFDWYIKKFGQEKFDELRRRFKSPRKIGYKTFELEELYEELKNYKVALTDRNKVKSGKIVKRPTPEEVRISKEKEIDYSLKGRLEKHEVSEKKLQ